MSKNHQSNRRRMYGRRQHELHERTERPDRFLGWVEVNLTAEADNRIVPDRLVRPTANDWALTPGLD